MSRLPWSFKKKKEKKTEKYPYRSREKEEKENTKKTNYRIIIILKIIDHDIRFKISRDKYFPLEKYQSIHRTPIPQTLSHSHDINNNDLTTIHPALINLRISNIETNMRTRQISLPLTPPRCSSPATSDTYDGNGSERKIRLPSSVLTPLPSPSPTLFLRKPLRREISSVTTHTSRRLIYYT